MQVRARAGAAARLKGGFAFRLKAVQILSMSEPDAARLIFRLERDPLFQKLNRFIRRNPARGAKFFLPLEGSAEAAAGYGFDWAAHRKEIELIRRIGRSRFEKYFLYGDIGFTLEEITAATALNTRDAKRLRCFVFAVSMQEHFLPQRESGTGLRRYTCAARVDVSRGRPAISWLLPQLASGGYAVDYPKLRAYQKSSLTAAEARHVDKLLADIRFLNARRSAIAGLVELLVRVQEKFLVSGDTGALAAFTASDAARALKVSPSTVSRAAARHSLLAPDGEELPLDSLMPNQRAIAINAITAILASAPEVTDQELADRLRRGRCLNLSRRAVNECRRLVNVARRGEGPL